MKKLNTNLIIFFLLVAEFSFAQVKDTSIINGIVHEATYNSQLENLAHELMDKIGPRLVGSPKMQQAH
ncbi:MAG: hypothetical protein ABI184_01195, partial [Ginsengibacter sp.]